MKRWRAAIALISILPILSGCIQQNADRASLWGGMNLTPLAQSQAERQIAIPTRKLAEFAQTNSQNADSVPQALCKNAAAPLKIPTYDRSGQAVHPKVLYFKDGWNGWKYWMSFTPYPNTNAKYENPSIVVSQNGVDWSVPKGLKNPLFGPPPDVKKGGYYSDPHLVMRGNTMELWYRYDPSVGGKAGDSVNLIYMMSSTNGVKWSEPRLIFNGPYRYFSPVILYENGWKVWFSESDGRLYYTESQDLKTWSEPVAVQLGIPGYNIWHQDIVHTSIGYEIVYSSFKKGQFNKDNQTLYYAYSADGIHFGRSVQILKPSAGTGRLDDKMIYRSSIVNVDGTYRLYYSAMSRTGQWHIFLTSFM